MSIAHLRRTVSVFALLVALALPAGASLWSDEGMMIDQQVRDLLRDAGQPLDRVRLRWAEGDLAFGMGRLTAAEAALREVQRELLERRRGYDAALAHGPARPPARRLPAAGDAASRHPAA